MMREASRRYRIEDAVLTGSPGAKPPLSSGSCPTPAPATPTSREKREVERLGREFLAMKAAIDTTKRELASLQGLAPGETPILRAASELDEVVASTERATTTILSAVEDIERAANSLRIENKCVPEGGVELGAIRERVVALYEACNFQDLTGQRIRKVVGTLKFLENCLDIVIQRGEAWERRELVVPVAPVSPAELLNGPALPGEQGHVTQRDVDAYFI